MGTIDRRTFLATGLKAGAVLTAIGSYETSRRARPARCAAGGSRRDNTRSRCADLARHHWRRRAGRRRPRRRPLRLAGERPAPRRAPGWIPDRGHQRRGHPPERVGLGGGQQRPSGLRRLRRSHARARTPPTTGPCRPPMRRGAGASRVRRRPSPPACGIPTGAHNGSGPGRPTRASSRTPTCGPSGPYPRGPSNGPPRTWRPPTATNCGSTDPRPTRGRASASPTSSTTKRPTSPAMVHAGRTNAFGVLHHWYGPGRGRPTSAPGLLVEIAVHYSGGRVVIVSSDGSWRTRKAEWLAAPQRNNDSGDFVEWIDARLHPTGWSSPGFDDSTWSAGGGARTGRHRTLHPPLRAAHPDRRARGRAELGAYIAERLRRGRLRQGLRRATQGVLRARAGRAHRPAPRRLHPRPGRIGLDHPQHPGDRSLLLLHPALRRADLPSLLVPRVPLPPDRPARRADRPRPGRLARTPRDDAAHRVRHLLLFEPEARAGVGALRALRPLHLPRAVHRHPDPREGPVPLGRGERVGDPHAHLRGTEPELAGAARHGAGPGPVLGGVRPGQRGLPQRRRPAELPDVHRSLPRLGVAVLPLDR